MKKTGWIVVLVLLTLPVADAEQKTMHDQDSMLNYSIGYQVGSDFRLQQFELRPEMIIKGIQDAVNQASPEITPARMRQSMAELGKRKMEFNQKRRENIKKGGENAADYRQQNAGKEGVVVTSSGLQYKIIKQGQGKSPSATDQVLVHYRGRLIDGTEFDSSYKRNRPASFKVNRVIKGWSEALQLMSPGAEWQLTVPPELGYGERGAGRLIPPDSTLIFDVELIAVK